MARVLNKELNLHREPTITAPTVAKLGSGADVRVVGSFYRTEGTWTEVVTPSGERGYYLGRVLEYTPSNRVLTQPTADALESPAPDAPVRFRLSRGEAFSVDFEPEDQHYVEITNRAGLKGYLLGTVSTTSELLSTTADFPLYTEGWGIASSKGPWVHEYESTPRPSSAGKADVPSVPKTSRSPEGTTDGPPSGRVSTARETTEQSSIHAVAQLPEALPPPQDHHIGPVLGKVLIHVAVNAVVGWGLLWILADRISSTTNAIATIRFLSVAGIGAPLFTLIVRQMFFGLDLSKELPWWASTLVYAGTFAAGFAWPYLYADFGRKF